MKRKSLTNAIFDALVIGASVSFGVAALAPAMAAPVPQQGTASSSAPTQTLQTVQVTGSHIPTTEIVTPKPVLTISRQQIQATGLSTIGQIFQQLPAISATMNAAFNFEGNGAANVDLRDLGPKRTLVLVNGHRWITNIDGTTDLNSIPLSAVASIQVLKSGASAIYGSDAIAGVINIILRKHMNGGEVSAYYGIWRGGGHWDGLTKKYSFTLGHQGNKYGWLFNAEDNKSRRIPADHRAFSIDPVPYTGVTRGSSNTPQGNFQFIAPTLDNPMNPNVTPASFTGLTAMQCPPRNFGTSSSPEFLPFCNLTITKGTSGQSPSDYVPFMAKDKYNWTLPSGKSAGDSVLNPLSIKAAYFSGHYDITNQVRATTSINYTRRSSFTTSAPNLWPLTSVSIAADQKYNPFGFAISDKPVQVAPTGGPNGGPLELPTLSYIGRRLSGFPERIRKYESDSFRFGAGLNGIFNLGAKQWNWDGGFIYMTLRNTEVQTAGTVSSNFDLAVGPAAQCAQTAGCVPINLFGGLGVDGNGTFTPAMVNYVYYPERSGNGTTERIAHFNIDTADLFNLPAGPVGFAAGYQHFNINGYFHPDPLAAAGLALGAGTTFPTNGGFHEDSVYSELSAPLLAKIPGFYHLNLDLAARYSKYSTFAGSTKFEAGLKWLPVQGLALRANWGQGFRAPNINELFQGQNITNPTVFDPCSAYTTPGHNATAAANCTAAGVPGGYIQPNQQIRTLVGGNQHLQAETSTSEEAGFVYNPRQLPAMTFSATYYRIKIKNSIQPFGPNNILDACYLSGIQKFCADVTRSPLGTITEINNLETNIGSTSTSGVDVGITYNDLPTPVGDFRFNLKTTHAIYYTERLPVAGSVQTTELVGIERAGSVQPTSIPAWKAILTVDWRLDNWGATWRVHYIGSLMEHCSDSLNGTPESLTNLGLCNRPNFQNNALSMNRMAPTVWHDVQATYHGPYKTTFSFGINNVFDKQPPLETQPIEDLAFDPTEYAALMGRFYYARVGIRF